MNQYLAMILQFGGNFNPLGFALCNGQIMAISQNTALFSLLGTNYGGNGTSNFALPDLRGRTAIGWGPGQAPSLSQYFIGEQSGSENVSILPTNLPIHSHGVTAVTSVGNQSTPVSNYLAEGPKSGTPPHQTSTNIYYNGAATTPLNQLSVSVNSGGGLPVSIVQPFLVITYIIALTGIFPARN